MNIIDLYKKESAIVLNNINNKDIEYLLELVCNAYKYRNKIYICGNGGNAGLVSNLVADLSLHPFVSEDKSKSIDFEKRLHIINLCENSAVITAIGNDLGFEHIYSEQLKMSSHSDDLLIAISGSGTSKNIVKAISTAYELDMQSFMFTKNEKTNIANYSCVITGNSEFPGQTGGNNNNFHFEDCVMKISHMITGLFKERIQNDNKSR